MTHGGQEPTFGKVGGISFNTGKFQAFFITFLFTDINKTGNKMCSCARLIIHFRNIQELRKDFTILSFIKDFTRPLAGLPDLIPHIVIKFLGVNAGFQELSRVFTDDFVLGKTGYLLKGFIGANNLLIIISNKFRFN